MSGSLNGKVAIVTGGSSGIGEATARRFARDGATTVIVARNIERGETVAREIQQAGGVATFIQTDVSDARQMEALVARVLTAHGRLDIAVNNAAAPPGEAGTMNQITDISVEQWKRTLDVNLTGVWLGMKFQIPAMVKTGGGAIVNVSSTAGGKAIAGMGAYCASKFGLNAITKVAALEFAQQGIRINAVLPGPVDSKIVNQVEALTPGYKKMISGLVPMDRMGTAVEIANAICWLCSDEASYITGTNFPVDGGMIEK